MTDMKFYVHIEHARELITFVFKVQSAGTTVNDIIQICEKELATRFQNESFTNGSVVRSARKPALSGSLSVLDGLEEKEDLFLVFTSVCSDVQHPPDSTSPKSADHPVKQQQPFHHKSLQNKQSVAEKEVLKCGVRLEAAGDNKKALVLYRDWLHKGNKSGDVWNQLVAIFLKAGRFDKALQNAEEGLKQHPNHEALNISYMECLVATDPKKALQVIVNYSKKVRSSGGGAAQELKHTLQMLLCKSYQKLNKRDMAIVLVEGVLREKESHQEALLEFAKLTFDLGQEQAIQSLNILLTHLVKDKDNKIVQEYLTEVCQKHEGMQYLQKVSGEAWKSVPALILLAGVFRNNGAVELSLRVLERAIDLTPDDPNAILSYIHLLEMLNNPDGAIKRVKAFCQSNCSSTVFLQTHSSVKTILNRLPEHIYLCEDESSSSVVPQVSALPSVYSSDDLTTLAIWFTAVKIIYVQGALAVLPELCQLLAFYHEYKELHLTNIRNEAAYFSCIKKVIQVRSPIPRLHVHQKFIYLVGDSHCISPAWQVIKYKGEDLTVHPVLSTGTKIWHLRPAGVFYPKTNFLNALSIVPNGAVVIMILGEIDCREALIQCVERCIYDSLEEAVECVINIYIHLLMELQKKHNWKIYVHPVPPVLDITRPVVTMFNSHLKVAIDTLESCGIYYLNGIIHQLVTQEGSHIRQQYAFDGTHLHPSYVTLLERSLEQS